jgi:hypothetical protein
LEVEVCGRVYGCHPEELDPKREKYLIEFVAAEIKAIKDGRRGLI